MSYSVDDDIVTLKNNEGEEVDFTNIAGINYKGNYYAILQPVELLEGMKDNEALVFKVTHIGGEDNFEIELNDRIIDGVFKEYNKLLDKTTGTKLKKSKGAGAVFGAATKAVKKTIWLVRFIMSIVATLGGVFIIIGNSVTHNDTGIKTFLYIIGAVAIILGLLSVRRLWKKRKK